MRAFRSLLRIAKSETDTRSRVLVEAQSTLAALIKALEDHDVAVAAERKATQTNTDAVFAYGAYFKRAEKQREALILRRNTAELNVNEARARLTEALTEQRKFERLIELAEERAKALAEARERAQLDEAATLRHARRSTP
jgi:flagellar export protein FliJ